MIKLTTPIPMNCNIAFSGGVDSLVAAHFAMKGRRNPTLLHFNHGCEYSDRIQSDCEARAEALGLRLVVGRIDGTRKDGQSLEDFWRRQRYRFLYSQPGDHVITAHHLDDAVETWVWSSLHGEGKLIPAVSEHHGKQLLRPFLLTKKDELVEYANHHGLVAVDDPYNNENHLTRNYIRSNMMVHVKYVNPGIDKVIRKKYLNGT